MPATTSTEPPFIHDRARFDGVPPNMSVRTTTPSPVFTGTHRGHDVPTAQFHIVFRTDRDGFDLILWANHVFESGL